MRITRRGQSMTNYKRSITFTQIMFILIGMALLGMGLFGLVNTAYIIFPGISALLMAGVGAFMLLIGTMTPLGQVFRLNRKMALLLSFIIVIVFSVIIYVIGISAGVEVI